MTNDRRLRAECEGHAVEVRWGLEIMLDLVQGSMLSASAAVAVAEGIREANPFYVSPEIVEEFARRAEALEVDHTEGAE